MTMFRQIFIVSLTILAALKFSTAQEIVFAPQKEGEMKGSQYMQRTFGDNGLFTVRIPSGGGFTMQMHYLNAEDEKIESHDISGVMKKKLFSATQLEKFNPILIGEKLYSVENSKSFTDITLVGRNKEDLAFTGEELVILKNDEKILNYSIEENDRFFSFFDISWGYEPDEPFVVKAFVFEKNNLKNVLQVNHGVKEKKYQDILGIGLTREGSFYILSTPLKKEKDKDPNLRSGKISLELHKASGKQEMEYEFEEGGVISSSVIEDKNGTYLKVLRLLDQGGITVSILEVKEGELVEKSEKNIQYDVLYEGNESNNVADFRTRIKEKKEGVISMKYFSSYSRNHRLSDGSYVLVNGMNVNDIDVLLLIHMNPNGEIGWTKCIPAKSIVVSGVDKKESFHAFFNDAKSRYDTKGNFVRYSNAGNTAERLPVHLTVDANGEIEERKVMTSGFEEHQKFDDGFRHYSFETEGIILTAKSTCPSDIINSCKAFTLGTINLNP